MKKSIIALIMCLSFLFLISVSVFAQTEIVARVGDEEFTNYKSAWSKVSKNGGTIEVLADWVLTESLLVPLDVEITVNMNGHNIRRETEEGIVWESGQIFLLDNFARLTVNGGTKTTEHKGSISSKGLWKYDTNGTHSLYGGLISGGVNGEGGGGIHMKYYSKAVLNNVTVAGNVSYDNVGAGGICLQDDYTELILNDSRVCYNISEMGGGGGIRSEGEDSRIVIKNNSSIDNNKTVRSNSDGGGIQINEGCSVSVDATSQVSYNYSARRGGGIYLYEGSLTLEDGSVLQGNVAQMEGGGVYIDEYSSEVKISADFIGNRVEDEEGGAIYINQEENVLIENAKLVGNFAKTKGGAIYVDSDDCVSLAGKCEMYQNTPNNLYLTDTDNLTSAKMSQGSYVGIFTEWEASSEDPVETSYNNIAHFVSDKENLEIRGEAEKIYYVDASDIKAPEAPEINIEQGIHRSGVTIKINQNEGVLYYYTLDGTTPDEKSSIYTDEIVLSVEQKNSVKRYTLKIIAVRGNVSSEVSSFSFVVSDVPLVTIEQDVINVKNLDEEAFLIVGSYENDGLIDVKAIPLGQDEVITLAQTGLKTIGTDYVKVFLWKDLNNIAPICSPKIIYMNRG